MVNCLRKFMSLQEDHWETQEFDSSDSVQGPWWHRSFLWDCEVQPDLRVQPRKQNAGRFTSENHHWFPCFCRWTIIIILHLDVRPCEDPILFDLTPKLVSSKELEHFSANKLAVLVLPYWFSPEVTQVVGKENAVLILYIFSSKVVLNCLIQPWFQDCDKSRRGGLWSRHAPGRP